MQLADHHLVVVALHLALLCVLMGVADRFAAHQPEQTRIRLDALVVHALLQVIEAPLLLQHRLLGIFSHFAHLHDVKAQ